MAVSTLAQTETLTNSVIIQMTQAGLSKELIVRKIKNSDGKYDISAQALIELKKAGVADEVIAMMLEKGEKSVSSQISERQPAVSSDKEKGESIERVVLSPQEALKRAKTIAIEKSSLNPSRQALEKELFKRDGWQKYNFNIVRLKEDADLYIEIGRVPFTWLTHRYVFRVYDRQSGTVITAGETTSHCERLIVPWQYGTSGFSVVGPK